MVGDYELHEKLDRIVEKFLFNQIINKKYKGQASTIHIFQFCKTRGYSIPLTKRDKWMSEPKHPSGRPISWLNVRVSDAINNGTKSFDLTRVDGEGKGITFIWRFKSTSPQSLASDMGCTIHRAREITEALESKD